MSTNISEEEFLRLQEQLIELRTANYNLEEQCSRQLARNKQLRVHVETLERECAKAHSSLNALRKVKTFELVQQNERLQLKLQAQEDEFRLQNQTLLQELSTLSRENEKLNSIIQLTAPEVESAIDSNEQIRKLKAESNALQRALSEERLRSAQEISRLKTALQGYCSTIDESSPRDLSGESTSEVPSSEETVGTTTYPNSPSLRDRESSYSDSPSSQTEVEVLTERNKTVDVPPLVETCKMTGEAELTKPCQIKQSDEEKLRKGMEELRVGQERYEFLKTSFLDLKQQYCDDRVMSEKKMHDLEERLKISIDEREKLKNKVSEISFVRIELEAQVEDMVQKLNESGIENELVHSQLVESIKAIKVLNENIGTLQTDKEEIARCLAEVKKLSESRMMMIEEMNSSNKQLLSEHENKIHHLENDKNLLEDRYKEQISMIMQLKNSMHEMEQQITEKDIQIKNLEQQVVDIEAERALSEKKGSVVCRDLKRQLAAERRRVEKLQDRLREVSDSTHGTLKLANEASKAADAETTSISSWSLMSGNTEQHESSTRESSLVAGSPTNGNLFAQADELDLEQENRNLLERITALQEEKWAIEEKINQLEQGSAAMAADLVKKSDIIQFYCMEGRPDPQPSSTSKKAVRKLSDFLKYTEEGHLLECNARMQRMLEELLTKNMYLQRDIEQMSKELERQSSKSSDKS